MREEYRDRAILLRTYDLSESSLIVHWFGEREGVCKTVVKGVNVKNSRYLGKLELFSFSEIHFMKSQSGSDLYSLIGCECEKTVSTLRTSYVKLLAASYFGSLIEHWLVVGQSCPEEFSLLERALMYLNDKKLEWKGVAHFEKELSRLLGYSTDKVEVRKVYTSSMKLMELRGKIKTALTPFSSS